ncbi:MAG TPA: M36 family metallopeptidase, partial [Rhodothermales bacterium]|nr:M36 family metallopeptidase [Rhodothermales bacterium]
MRPSLRFACPLGVLLLAAATPARAQTPTYRVYPLPVESPLHTTPAPPADARVLVADPADAVASPYGWHDVDGLPGADRTTTDGNNVTAYLDADGDFVPDPDEMADGGAALAFAFALDTANPEISRDARLTQAFYTAGVSRASR